MSAPKPEPAKLIPAHPRLAALVAFVLIYCPLLGLTFNSTGFSALADARSRIEQITQRPPPPLPPLPVLKTFERRELVLQRDPLQALHSPPHTSPDESSLSPPFGFLAAYSDDGHACVVSRDKAGLITHFCIGDKIDGDRIVRIDSASVIIEADGKPHVVAIDPGPLER